MESTVLTKLSDLVFDYDLYPRSQLDGQHVHYMREARAAGVKFPPLIADKKSRRVIDGFHRGRMYAREDGPDAEVEVILRTYKSEGAMFLDAMRLNSAHGRMLTTFDRSRCLLRAEELKLQPEEVAAALSITCEALGKLRADRVGSLRAVGNQTTGEKIPLKRTIAHMAGRTLTRAQSEANARLSGMNAVFYVNQVILLLENKLLDWDDGRLIPRLQRLHELLGEMPACE